VFGVVLQCSHLQCKLQNGGSRSHAVIRDFPQHIYQPSGGWRAFLLIISLLLGGFSAAGVWYFGTMHEVRSAHAAIWMVGICLVFVFLSGVLIALLFRSRVILRPDSVESRELFSTGKLFREDILGRRLQQNPRGPASLVLVPRDSSRKPLCSTMSRLCNAEQALEAAISAFQGTSGAGRFKSPPRAATECTLSYTPIDICKRE
jgi:hypothetical protein